MHDGVQYDQIQGQGHESFKVGNPAIFKSCILRHLRDFEVGTNVSCEESTVSPRTGLIFLILLLFTARR